MSYPGANTSHGQNRPHNQQPQYQPQQQPPQQQFQQPQPQYGQPHQQYQQQQYQQQQQPYQVPQQPNAHHATNVPQEALQLQQEFQFSTCMGNKKALLIGINYFGQKGELKGCINDCVNVRRHVCQSWGFSDQDRRTGQQGIIQLTDDQQDPNYRPTRQNIVNAIGWLVGGTQPGDSLLLHYSGHGGRVKDRNGDEESGYDSCIYPVDYQQAGEIIDDELHERLVRFLPRGVRLTLIFDACHSGSMADLPYTYNPDGSLASYKSTVWKDSLLSAGKTAMMSGFSTTGLMRAGFGLAKALKNEIGSGGGGNREQAVQQNTSQADVICWSGCMDNQTSADTFIQNASTGAMSHAFIKAIDQCQGRPVSFLNLLQMVRSILAQDYKQIPQLSSGYPMDMNLQFVM